MGECCHLDSEWCRTFLILFSLTRRTNNYSRTKHHWENPRTWRGGWSGPLLYFEALPTPDQHKNRRRYFPWASISSSGKRELLRKQTLLPLQCCESQICITQPLRIWLDWEGRTGLAYLGKELSNSPTYSGECLLATSDQR